MIQPEQLDKMMDELEIDRMVDELGRFGVNWRAIGSSPWLWAISRIRGVFD